MRARLPALLALFLPLTAVAQTASGTSDLDFLTARALRAGFLEPDVVLLDPATGELAFGVPRAGSRDFDWHAYPGEHFFPLNPDSLRTADLDGDGHDDLILPSYASNRVGIVWGQADRRAKPRNDEFVLGAGPAGAEPLLLPSLPDHLALALVGDSQPRFNTFELPGGRVSGTTALGPGALRGLSHATTSVPPTSQGGISTQFFGVATTFIDDTGAGPIPLATVELIRVEVAHALLRRTKYGEIVLSRGALSLVDSAYLTGEATLPWFIVWEPGNTVVDATNSNTQLRMSLTPAPTRLSVWRSLTFMVHNEGQHAAVYNFNPATGFVLRELLAPPPGESFSSLLPLANGRLFASMRVGGDGFFQDPLSAGASVPYAVYEDGGGGFQIVAQGNTPLFSKFAAHATVMLFTADPLGGDAFEFEAFLAGNWARNASLAGGQIHATRENFLGPVNGLGNPMPVQLGPAHDPGPGAAVLANQFGDTGSSLFFHGAAGADGNATVTIAPPPGPYDSAVHVTLSAAAGTAIHYRVNAQPWQAAQPGGFFIAADAVIDYYGQAASGALGSIKTAAYTINLSFASDANNDFVPDSIAAALGLDPFGDGDADADGFTNAEEILNGTDPLSANSFPGALAIRLPPTLAFETFVALPSPTAGSADIPATGGTLRVLAPADGLMAESPVGRNGTAHVEVADYYGSNGNHLFRSRSGLQFHDALITEVTIPALEGDAPMLLGFAMPPGFQLPGPEPAPPGPLPVPYPSSAQIAAWIDDTLLSLAAFSETRGLDPDDDSIEATPDTTLALAAFSAWVRQQLEATGDYPVKVKFPWMVDAAARPITRADLAVLETPSGPHAVAHELARVVQQLYSEIVTRPDYLPLRVAIREMIRFAGDPDRPIILGRLWNPPDDATRFLETGILDDVYLGVVTPPPATLNALRLQLLASPQPRPVLDLTGDLVLLPEGSWAVRAQNGIIHPLRARTLAAEVDGTDISLRLTPAEIALYSNTGFLPGMRVRVTGFPATQGQAHDLELLSITIIDPNLESGLLDSDGDGMDDAFELRFFNSLASGFWDDSDGDGFTDGEEYAGLTDPADASSFPPGSPAFPRGLRIALTDEEIILRWEGGSQADYTVQFGLATGWQSSPLAPANLGNGTFEWRTPLDDIPADAFRVEVHLE